MQSPDLLDIVPEHVADPVRRAPWRVRLVTGCGDGLLSLLLNGAVVGWLIGVGWPLRQMPAPQAISVELVDHMPGPEGAGTSSALKGGGGAPKPEAVAAVSPAAPPGDHEAQTRPEPPASPTPEPHPEPKPMVEPAATPSVPADAPAPSQATPVRDAPPPATPATPPPPEHPDSTPQPQLVEAPSAPPPAPPRDNTNVQSAAPPSPAEVPAVTPAESPAQRPVQATPEEADAVPPPAPPPDAPKPLTAEQQRQAENTAKLAAVLPFGANIPTSPFQPSSSALGQGTSTAYRGQVYANFDKAQDVVEDARAKHLKGQAVIAFTVDDRGDIATIGIAVSSGNPEVDQAALELIRRAAPFPPPPPGAQRSFSPAIRLGLDE